MQDHSQRLPLSGSQSPLASNGGARDLSSMCVSARGVKLLSTSIRKIIRQCLRLACICPSF